MVTKNDIQRAARAAGICLGDMVLVHSSFKSLGPVEGGAETVIAGLLDAIGPEGTLVLPTFAQKDFANAYETWHMDKPSDTGYLTEYFRTRPGSVRSDQATHAVAACGAKARWLTETHGHTHNLFGNMGDTPFSADSPWEKMFRENAKILMLGVTPLYTTFRHYVEYNYVNDCLARIEGTSVYETMKAELYQWNKPGIWPNVCNVWVCEQMAQQGKIRTSQCGDATFTCYDSKDFVDTTRHYLDIREHHALWDDFTNGRGEWVPLWMDWLARLDAAATEKER